MGQGFPQTPVRGGTLVFGRGADSVGLDPAVVSDGESLRVTRSLYDSLLAYKRESTENPDDIPTVKQDPNLQLILRPSMNVGYLWWNVEKEPFRKFEVRRAIAHAINKRAIVQKHFGGIGIPAKNMLPPSLWGYQENIDD
jgi:hypothetical protein